MEYEFLARRSWREGHFSAQKPPEGHEGACGPASPKRQNIRREMEGIGERECWDAPACLNAHKEDAMKLAPFVKFREEKFGAVLFETRSEKVYTLSPTAAAVVQEAIAATDTASALTRLKERFEDRQGRLEAEALAFLSQLKEKGLLAS